ISETTGWVTGWTGTILYTEDGGNEWTPLSPPPVNAYEAIYFVDDQTGWAAGYGGKIIHTNDGGETWSEQVSGTQFSVYDIQFINADTGWAVSSRFEGFNTDPARRIHGTTDGGETWTLLFGENDEPPLLSLFFKDAANGFAVGETGTILRSTDGGNSWTELMQDNQFHFRDVFFLDAYNGFVVGTDLSLDHKAVIFHTTDGGETWDSNFFDDDQSLQGVFFTSSDEGWAVGGDAAQGAVILHTEDGGENWEYQEVAGAQSLTKVCFISDELGWAVGYDGTIITTSSPVSVNENEFSSENPLQVKVYPVPFDRTTTLEYGLEKAAEVQVTILNQLGRTVYKTRDLKGAGQQKISWDAGGLPQGFYFYTLQAGDHLVSGKMLKH
ncbi:MAG: YCF48-related protein, partial [bacterium]